MEKLRFNKLVYLQENNYLFRIFQKKTDNEKKLKALFCKLQFKKISKYYVYDINQIINFYKTL